MVGSLLASQEAQSARWRPLAERGHALRRDAQRFAVGLARYREGLDGAGSRAPKQRLQGVRPTLWEPTRLQPPVEHSQGPEM